ncbi:MAG: AAA family ATPase [Planctomycetaceae bacterium]
MQGPGFGFTQPPFSPAPDARCCADVPSFQRAQQDLHDCLASGRGIAVLTAPAGTGKTLICCRLAEQLATQFRVIFLPTGGFATPAGLLQTVLFELGQPYRNMSDPELRLQFASATRILLAEQHGVLLIDEAHTLASAVFEEIRQATTLIQDGQPLLRVLLSGQFPLEERLATPELEAINQRIGDHVTLDPLSRSEAAEYIAYRLRRAGAEMDDVFAPNAVATIVVAADGNPHRLNQLCGRSLALADQNGVRPVDDRTVRTALEELKRLPLQWQEPPPDAARTAPVAPTPADAFVDEESPTDSDSPRSEISHTAAAVVEFGARENETRPNVANTFAGPPAAEERTPLGQASSPAMEVVEIGGDPPADVPCNSAESNFADPTEPEPETSSRSAERWEPVEPQARPPHGLAETTANIPVGSDAESRTPAGDRFGSRPPVPDPEIVNVDDRHAILLEERRRMLDAPQEPPPVDRPRFESIPQPEPNTDAGDPPPGPRLDGEPAGLRFPTSARPAGDEASGTTAVGFEPRRASPRRDARAAFEQHLRDLDYDTVFPGRGGDANPGSAAAANPGPAERVDLVQRLNRLQGRR